MNDLEEVRFGFHKGREIFEQSEEIRAACDTVERYNVLKHYFYYYYNEFDQKQALDVYVFCLSQHERENEDGRLSMWRGYGGQGKGVGSAINQRIVRGKYKLFFAPAEELHWLACQPHLHS